MLKPLLRAIALCAVLGLPGPVPAAADDDIPLRSGALVEIHRKGALAAVQAVPGVVMVDCFADW